MLIVYAHPSRIHRSIFVSLCFELYAIALIAYTRNHPIFSLNYTEGKVFGCVLHILSGMDFKRNRPKRSQPMQKKKNFQPRMH